MPAPVRTTIRRARPTSAPARSRSVSAFDQPPVPVMARHRGTGARLRPGRPIRPAGAARRPPPFTGSHDRGRYAACVAERRADGRGVGRGRRRGPSAPGGRSAAGPRVPARGPGGLLPRILGRPDLRRARGRPGRGDPGPSERHPDRSRAGRPDGRRPTRPGRPGRVGAVRAVRRIAGGAGTPPADPADALHLGHHRDSPRASPRGCGTRPRRRPSSTTRRPSGSSTGRTSTWSARRCTTRCRCGSPPGRCSRGARWPSSAGSTPPRRSACSAGCARPRRSSSRPTCSGYCSSPELADDETFGSLRFLAHAGAPCPPSVKRATMAARPPGRRLGVLRLDRGPVHGVRARRVARPSGDGRPGPARTPPVHRSRRCRRERGGRRRERRRGGGRRWGGHHLVRHAAVRPLLATGATSRPPAAPGGVPPAPWAIWGGWMTRGTSTSRAGGTTSSSAGASTSTRPRWRRCCPRVPGVRAVGRVRGAGRAVGPKGLRGLRGRPRRGRGGHAGGGVRPLAPYKRPKAYFATSELPHTATGKLLRRAVPAHLGLAEEKEAGPR